MKSLTKIKSLVAATSIACGVMFAPAASAIDWTAWDVGSGSTTVAPDGTVTFVAGLNSVSNWSSNQNGNKAYYSTDDFNGMTVGSLSSLTYNCISGCSNGPPGGPGPGGPYTNIWVTDAGGLNRAVLLVLPTGAGDFQNHITFSLDQYAVNEQTTGGVTSTWLTATPATALTFSQVAGLLIAAGPPLPGANTIDPAPPGAGAGWCATSLDGCDDGISLVWGNRSGMAPGGGLLYDQPVTIGDIALAPEPGSLALLGLGLAGLGMRRRKISA